jgi:hypothetical protein
LFLILEIIEEYSVRMLIHEYILFYQPCFLVPTVSLHVEWIYIYIGDMKMQDSEAYACLLNVLAPECSAKPSPMSVKDLLHRARLVLEHADRMGCKRYLALKDIVWFTISKSRFCGSYFPKSKILVLQ